MLLHPRDLLIQYYKIPNTCDSAIPNSVITKFDILILFSEFSRRTVFIRFLTLILSACCNLSEGPDPISAIFRSPLAANWNVEIATAYSGDEFPQNFKVSRMLSQIDSMFGSGLVVVAAKWISARSMWRR